MGAWSIYGLGSESESLPAYVVMPDPDGALEAGQPMYGHGFLPSAYQPTLFRAGESPVLNLNMPTGIAAHERRKTIELIRQLNEANLTEGDDEFAARLRTYNLAFRMQTEAPEIFDLRDETEETLNLYGVGVEPTDDYGRRCLLARRLVENGVRFTVVVSGGGAGTLQWDAHSNIEENHRRMSAQVDQPIAGLIKDLKRRGLLDSTLIYGAASSVVLRKRRRALAETIIISALLCGWPAAEFKAAASSEPPMPSACAPLKSPTTFATSTPQFSINSGSTKTNYLSTSRPQRTLDSDSR